MCIRDSPIIIGFLCTFFHGINNTGYITQKDIRPIVCTHHYIFQLAGIIKLTFYTQRIGFTTNIEVTTGNILVDVYKRQTLMRILSNILQVTVGTIADGK